jgi:hypothetical protein
MTADERRLLELLVESPDGCTEALLRVHGFKLDEMVDVVNAGLATAIAERMLAGGKGVEVTRMRITHAGRVALERS